MASVQLTSKGSWEEPLHFDGGASILHMGLTLWGSRKLVCKTKTVREEAIVLECDPGHVYFAPVTGFQHQVQHTQPPQVDYCNLPGLGEVSVSIMIRTSMFAHSYGRCTKVPPGPHAVFEMCSQAITAWLQHDSLFIPSLRECQASEATLKKSMILRISAKTGANK